MGQLPRGVPARPQSPAVTPRQMNMVFDNAELQGMNAAQRAKVIAHLASLLIQAAGVTTGKERDDDER
ncbi:MULTISPECIES: hypothetical protein [unclassified Burkholderia]|uniref:hypothetical protein n=1 Tax=unclassified Burkholderia TaxID=2613784 RepID=UPI000F5AABCE|nr:MULTISPECIES: hypothetical protein [unclassified Burkholderia]RQS24165.1 hypothetical protein DIE05_26420 [Burkholderia sp. Bp8995]RQS39319.1 hypothetical protein DIE00_34005 [Burkholderia sp. Bp8989]